LTDKGFNLYNLIFYLFLWEDLLMYAVVKTGGKQYKMTPGDIIRVEKLTQEVGSRVEFDQVLAVSDGTNLTVGQPIVSNARVVGTLVDNDRAKKIIVFKIKRKKQYRLTKGHRQSYSAVKVDAINLA
jgi:large subunit ribosomal protein L21